MTKHRQEQFLLYKELNIASSAYEKSKLVGYENFYTCYGSSGGHALQAQHAVTTSWYQNTIVLTLFHNTVLSGLIEC